jgi:hypothetical protein
MSICRPKNYNPIEVDSINNTIIQDDIKHDVDILTPYFKKYINFPFLREQIIYNNIYLKE